MIQKKKDHCLRPWIIKRPNVKEVSMPPDISISTTSFLPAPSNVVKKGDETAVVPKERGRRET